MKIIIDSTDAQFMAVIRLLAGASASAGPENLRFHEKSISLVVPPVNSIFDLNGATAEPTPLQGEAAARIASTAAAPNPPHSPHTPPHSPHTPPPHSPHTPPPHTPPPLAPDESARVPFPPHTVVEVDAEGLPHDIRIHSASREKNKDGTWRIRRNSDKAEVERVKGELKKLMGVVPAAPPPPPSAASVTPPPPPPEPPPVLGATDPFMKLMAHINERKSAGTMTIKRAIQLSDEYATSMGLEATGNMLYMRTRPDLIAGFRAILDGVAS